MVKNNCDMNLFLLILLTSFSQTSTLSVTSPAFKSEDFIPVKYTCDGENISPPLNIANIPNGTKTLVLIMDDPDAPNGTFDHWLVWNIAPTSSTIMEDNAPGTEGKNGSGNNGYKGPCPPSGIHRYFFRVYALDTKLELKPGAVRSMLEESLQNHVLATGEMVGLYKKLELKK